jgi:hypothetical protein
MPRPSVPGEDPGWWAALRPLFLPWLILRPARASDSLTAQRRVFSVVTAHLPVWLVFLAFSFPWDAGDEGSAPALVLIYGLLMLVVVAWIGRRTLDRLSLVKLAASYRSRMFAGIGVAETPAMVAIGSLFVGGSLWMYFLGLVPALIDLWMAAPSRRNIARDQAKLSSLGSPLSLTEALMAPIPGRE